MTRVGMPGHMSIKKLFGVQNKPSKELKRKSAEEINDGWNKYYNKIIKILLLGSGETGKTTIIKQMKILHVKGFSDEERLEHCNIIRDNVFESISTLVSQMSKLRIALDNKSNLVSWTFINNMCLTHHKEYSQEYFGHVKNLWADKGVQECYSRAAEYSIPDCAKYFLDRLDEIKKPDFFPNDQFLLRARRTTVGIQKIEFDVRIPKKYGGGGTQKFWMFDVGGQKGERRKWIQVFDGIQTVLFLAACNAFDQVLVESDGTKINRLQESVKLFEDVWLSRFLRDAGFIVFLNKQDLLKSKIESGKRIEDYFPQYSTYELAPEDIAAGDDEALDYIKARSFIRDLFLLATDPTPSRKKSMVGFHDNATLKYKEPPRELYFHFTTATDTNNVQRVFGDVHSMILNKGLRDIGFA